MSQIIAITGKDGAGKTTLSSMIIQHLIASGERPVLAMDADEIERLSVDHKYIIVESETGRELRSHKIDVLAIVADCSVRGLRTAKRISDYVDASRISVCARGLIINRAPDGALPDDVCAEAAVTGLPIAAIIPLDKSMSSMGGVPPSSPSRKAVANMMARVGPRRRYVCA